MRKVLKSLSPWPIIALALAILMLPLKWIGAWLLASGIHELLHILAVRLMGGRIDGFRLGPEGAVLEASVISQGKLLFCIMAGPIGCLLILPLVRHLPALAVCIFLQSIFNLLPLEGLDGGRVLRILLGFVFAPDTAERNCRIIDRCLLGMGILAGLFITGSLLPLCFLLLLRRRRNSEKYLANRCSREYNRESITCEV